MFYDLSRLAAKRLQKYALPAVFRLLNLVDAEFGWGVVWGWGNFWDWVKSQRLQGALQISNREGTEAGSTNRMALGLNFASTR
ncbi:MAG: hypothetical protein KDD14_11125 [Saprospiraceae bacterium]|nr:hypothetical protein [Saprospiraceae bacterium]